jgi:hypothetical protein
VTNWGFHPKYNKEHGVDQLNHPPNGKKCSSCRAKTEKGNVAKILTSNNFTIETGNKFWKHSRYCVCHPCAAYFGAFLNLKQSFRACQRD